MDTQSVLNKEWFQSFYKEKILIIKIFTSSFNRGLL